MGEFLRRARQAGGSGTELARAAFSALRLEAGAKKAIHKGKDDEFFSQHPEISAERQGTMYLEVAQSSTDTLSKEIPLYNISRMIRKSAIAFRAAGKEDSAADAEAWLQGLLDRVFGQKG